MRLSIPCAVLLAWALLSSGELRAQNPLLTGATGDGISVYGTGELSARPNWVEIDLTVSGKAELTGDALVKYRDGKKRVIEALEKLKLAGLSSEEVGLSISAGNSLEQQQRIMNGMPQTPTKPQIEVNSVLRVRLKDIRNLPADEVLKIVGKLLDVAQDSGVAIGPSQAEIMRAMRFGNYNNLNANVPVRFVVADLAEMREKAYELAVADAQSRGTRLAKLNRLKLGATRYVQEINIAGDQPIIFNNPNTPQAAATAVAEEPRITSSSLSGIPVQVKLLVRFAIEPLDPSTAQK